MQNDTIQIVLANRPRLLREMLARVIDETDGLSVIGQVDDLSQLPEIVRRKRPHCVVTLLHSDDSLGDDVRRLANLNSGLHVVAISYDGRIVKDANQGIHVENVTLDELIVLLKGQRSDAYVRSC